MERVIEYSEAEKLRNHSKGFSEVEDSYLYCKLCDGSAADLEIQEHPLKLNGTLLLLMRGGSEFPVELNQETYIMRPNSFLVVFPGSVVHFKGKVPDDINVCVLFFNLTFLQNVNLNTSAIALPANMSQRPEPVGLLSQDECDLLGRYMELLHLTSLNDNGAPICKNIATTLIAALFYQMIQIYHRRLATNVAEDGSRPSRRSHDYVREFMRLLHMHFIKERSVSYYAGKLFISSKYLSLLVKEATGQSASKWIDDFVIMEAKNMLRFSGMNIQQIAYALNFPTQSSFGKYFKHLTGMSPTQYQKS